MWTNYGGRGRRRCRGRPKKQRFIQQIPPVSQFIPSIPPHLAFPKKPPVYISYDEFEALRLVDYEGLSQEEAGIRMNISRGTIWRLVQSARKKIITALLESRAISIVPTAPLTSESQQKSLASAKQK